MCRFYIHDFGFVNAMGLEKSAIASNWQRGVSPGMVYTDAYFKNHEMVLGVVQGELPVIPPQLANYSCRNNQLLLQAFNQIQPEFSQILNRFGSDRIGIVLGTSTSGISSAEIALSHFVKTGEVPAEYHFLQQDIGAGAEFLRQYLQLSGPTLTVSTACSSSGNAFITATRLINSGYCDAAIVGGADSLCQMTVQGFSSLNAVSRDRCQPFSRNRCGINIGEGAALFLISQEPAELELLAVGCSSDAYHISAPEPTGKGATAAIQDALQKASLNAEDIDYINLHGTATPLNDAMESLVIHKIFREATLCSSTKSLTGHTLGAASATELALCTCLIDSRLGIENVPPQIWDEEYDQTLEAIKISNATNNQAGIITCMSNSFAFGGNNTSIIVGRNNDAQ